MIINELKKQTNKQTRDSKWSALGGEMSKVQVKGNETKNRLVFR